MRFTLGLLFSLIICALYTNPARASVSISYQAVAAASVSDTAFGIDEARIPACATQRHLYGTISSVRGSKFVIKSRGSAGTVYLLTSKASFSPRQLQPRAGLVLRAHGCFVANSGKTNIFKATYVTLATSWRQIQFIPDRSVTESPEVSAIKAHPSPHPSPPAPGTPPPTQVSQVKNGSTEDAQSCGGYRWPTKVGADGEAALVNLTPQDASIAKLNQMAIPSALSATVRAKPTETIVYRLRNVSLQAMGLAHDRDYHLDVTEAGGAKMRLESPDPACASNSVFIKQLTAVRSYIEANHLTSGTILTVTGVGFFDPPGSGALELHPLLSICAGRGCSPTAMSARRKTSGR